MTLGNAAAAGVPLIVWCWDCGYQVEPDPAELARRYSDQTTVIEWPERLVCSRCGRREVDIVVSGVWSKDCGYQVEPDPVAMAARYGAKTSVLDWHKRLVCSHCGGREGTKRS